MPFPESPRVLYTNNPLAEVICQIRFPAILRIGSGDVADFQDRIREGYPLYQLQEPAFDLPSVPKELAAFVEQMMPKPPGPRTHKFLTKDSGRFISLSQDFLALSESNYTEWKLFQEEVGKAEKALREVYKPAFYSRLGLRYRDVISPDSLGLGEVKWSDLLSQPIIAELGDPLVANTIKQIRTRCVIELSEIPGGRVILTHGLFKETETAPQCYLIDADFAIENVEVLDETFNILDKFNRLAGRLFRWAITEKLHDAMGPKSI